MILMVWLRTGHHTKGGLKVSMAKWPAATECPMQPRTPPHQQGPGVAMPYLWGLVAGGKARDRRREGRAAACPGPEAHGERDQAWRRRSTKDLTWARIWSTAAPTRRP